MELIVPFLFFSFIAKGCGVCYFSVEYQGIFSTQSPLSSGGSHKYSQVTILPEAIPVWGICHEMTGSNVILHDATGGQECYRCFTIKLHSPNIIQVYAEELDKCYLNDGAARASCPTALDIKTRVAREIMLYKSRSFTQDGQIDRMMCPFSGKFHFTYDVNDGTENTAECADSNSMISNCPRGSEFELRFSQCRFRDTSMTLKCLGDWKGDDGYRYFALWDSRASSEDQPQYRCAMYHIDEDSGRVFISFSIDATCTNRLQSPWDGYETMVLTPVKRPSPPAPVHSHSCVFPQWSYGNWKDIQIQGRELWWKDLQREKFYHTLCLMQNNPNGERYALYSLNQCGDEEFMCIWIKSRDRDVLEFKIATVQYNYFNKTRICADEVFVGQQWHTQGRIQDSRQKTCPVLGEYTGVIPDETRLCAKLASDCNNPALMHYTVSCCANSSEILETFGTRVKRNVYRITNPRELISRRRHRVSQNPIYYNGTGFHSALPRPSRGSHRRESFRSIPKRNFRERTLAQERTLTQRRRHSSSKLRPRSGSLYELLPRSEDPEDQPAPTTRLPFPHEKPFYYYVDRYGNKVKEIRQESVVAEREYQCLGQWKEGGIMYTFTYRLDVNTYECFAGVVINDQEAFIIEAGIDCERGLQPLAKGMKLVKKASCDELQPKNMSPSSPPVEVAPHPSRPSLPAWWPSTSRRPWLKKSTTTTMKPRWKNQKPRRISNSSQRRTAGLISFLFCLLTIYLQT